MGATQTHVSSLRSTMPPCAASATARATRTVSPLYTAPESPCARAHHAVQCTGHSIGRIINRPFDWLID